MKRTLKLMMLMPKTLENKGGRFVLKCRTNLPEDLLHQPQRRMLLLRSVDVNIFSFRRLSGSG